jgi:hypothetical protein
VIDQQGDTKVTARCERHGDWQLTASGRRFWLLDPRADEIDIDDIAHHLARICRWGGAPTGHYSVAEHSVHLATHFANRREPVLARWALLHDAAEAYLGDIVRPLKPYIHGIGPYERQLETMIWSKYGLVGDLPAEVVRVDTAILGDERDQLFGPNSVHSRNKRPGETGIGARMVQMEAPEAKRAFLAVFAALFLGA